MIPFGEGGYEIGAVYPGKMRAEQFRTDIDIAAQGKSLVKSGLITAASILGVGIGIALISLLLYAILSI